MSLRGTAMLAGLLIALCAAYYTMTVLDVRKAVEKQVAKQLFAFAPAEIADLSIQQVDAPAVRAARDEAGAWSIVEPNKTIRALQPLWDRVASRLAALPNERTLGPSSDLAQYGLKEPALTLKAATRKGDKHELRFGFEEPTKSFRYAQLDAGPIFLVNAKEFFEFNRSLQDLRHRFLVNDREAPLIRIEFARIWTGESKTPMKDPPPIGTESIKVAAARPDSKSPWRLVEPTDASADQELVGALVNEVQFGQATDFIDAPKDLKDYGLDPPRERVTVIDEKTKQAQTIFYGTIDKADKDGHIFAKRAGEDAVFRVDGNVLAVFPRSPTSLREQHLFTGAVKEAQSISYVSRDDKFTVKRGKNGAWVLSDPEEETDQLVVSDFLGGLKDIKAMGFPEGTAESLGMKDPDFTITLAAADGRSEAVPFRANGDDATLYYALQPDGTPVTVEASRAKRYVLHRTDLRDRTLLRFDPFAVSRISFTLDDADYDFEKVHEKWIVRQPEGKHLANQTDAYTILKAFAGLKAPAATEAESADKAKTGLDKPIFKLEAVLLNRDNGEQTKIGPVIVGNPTPDDLLRRYCTVEGKPGVYRIKQESLQTVREALRGLVAAPAAPAAETPPPASN